MSTQCWHHYVTDLDGADYCDRCGDCPAERKAEAEWSFDPIDGTPYPPINEVTS